MIESKLSNKFNLSREVFLVKKFKKIISLACVAATLCSVGVVSASAYTRRLYGDVNGDGVISNADADLIQNYLVGIGLFDNYQKIAADVDGNGDVTIDDVTMIQKLLAGMIDEFPVGVYFLY